MFRLIEILVNKNEELTEWKNDFKPKINNEISDLENKNLASQKQSIQTERNSLKLHNQKKNKNLKEKSFKNPSFSDIKAKFMIDLKEKNEFLTDRKQKEKKKDFKNLKRLYSDVKNIKIGNKLYI